MGIKKIIVAFAILSLFKCDEKWTINEELLSSASPDISGSWSISSVEQNEIDTVSYTHLTLPTIYSV